MKNPHAKPGRITIALLALASLFLFLPPCAQAARAFNGKIAFGTSRDGNNEIYLMNPDGTGQVNISNNPASDVHPHWSPDGTKIAFTSFRDGNNEIYVMNADGTGQTRLTFNTTQEDEASWSPDGTKIAFISDRDGNIEIYVMNADGTNQTRLTNNSSRDLAPSFSPDGKKIVFESDRDGNIEIYVMNADGTGQTRLTNNASSDDLPSFSPDGTKLLFQSDRVPLNTVPQTLVRQVFVMNADGTNPVQLTTAAADSFNPAFSPDGTKITFVSNRDVNFEIYVMDANGANQTRITNNTVFDFTPSWQPILNTDTIGVFRPSTGQWLLRNSNSAGSPDLTFSFGQAGDLPITGDWNGDGRTDIGVYRGNTFFLATLETRLVRTCATCSFVPTTVLNPLPSFTFGQAGDLPVAGDWNGDGKADVGVFRSGQFLLREPLTIGTSTVIVTVNFNFGQAGDLPLAGDWNGDGTDTIGIFRASIGQFQLRNSNSAGIADTVVSGFGSTGDQPLAGDWNGDGVDTIGFVRNTQFLLSNSSASSNNGTADLAFNFGQAADIPVAGDWNGLNQPPNSGVNSPSEGSSSVGQTQIFTTTCSDPDGWHDIHTIDFKISRSDPNGSGNGVPLVLWVQFDENRNVIRLYDTDLQVWREGVPGSNVTLSTRFADLNLANSTVQGSGPTGPSVQVRWELVFKQAATGKNYKQLLRIEDDAGASTNTDRVGSWSITH